MSPDQQELQELARLSQRLNEETDELNNLILSLEKRLAGMSIGVSVWLGLALVESDSDYSSDEDDRDDRPWRDAWDIGYAKLGSEWRIATRHYRFRWSAEKDNWGDYQIEDDATVQVLPLRDAPRAVRVEAAECLDALVSKLREKVTHFIDSIQKAKKLASD